MRSLLDIPSTATVVEGDVEREVAIGELKHGDVVVARLGCQIPADGEIISGEAGVNQSSLTGEPAGNRAQNGRHRIRWYRSRGRRDLHPHFRQPRRKQAALHHFDG